MKPGIRSYAILIVLAVVIFLAGSSTAYVRALGGKAGGTSLTFTADRAELAEPTPVPVPGGPEFIMINPYAFQPNDEIQKWTFLSGGILSDDGPGAKYYGAALNLPHGAKINKFVVYYTDQTTDSLTVSLNEYDLGSRTKSELGTWTSTGQRVGPQIEEIKMSTKTTVDNQSKTYYLLLKFSGNRNGTLELNAVRIDYVTSSR